MISIMASSHRGILKSWEVNIYWPSNLDSKGNEKKKPQILQLRKIRLTLRYKN